MDWRVPFSDVDYGLEEVQAVRQILDSRWLTMGEVTERFEQSFADYVGVSHAVAVTNATSALHMANLALGVGPGDEVIVPSLTFVATVNAVLYARGTPVFADIGGEANLSISPESITACLTPRTKAVVVMHYGGYMCDMPAILKLADNHGLAVIEDAAHGLGSELADRKAGAWGEVGCFSFFSNKNLATGEGGMVVTNRDDIAEKLRLLRSHGMTSHTWDRHTGRANSYDVISLGYNYRIDELRSALGLVQLEKLDANNDKRRNISSKYRDELRKMEHLSIPYDSFKGLSAAHLFPILLHENMERRTFIESLRDQGIQTSIHYPPVHQFTYFREKGYSPYLPATDEVAAREVTLPLFPTMSSEQLELVISAVEHKWHRAPG